MMKRIILSLSLIFLLLGFSNSCSLLGKKAETSTQSNGPTSASTADKVASLKDLELPHPRDEGPNPVTPIVTEGYQYRPVFSPNGSLLAFIGSGRVRHEQRQAYLFDVKAKSERRLTFQVGDVFDISFSQDGEWVAYASSTDEIKENPTLLRQPNAAKAVGADLYMSRLDGSNIHRLTMRPGIDADVQWISGRSTLLFSSERSGNFDLFTVDLSTQGTRPVISHPSDDRDGQFSPNGKELVWVRRSPALPSATAPGFVREAQLLWQKAAGEAPIRLVRDATDIHSPRWDPSGEYVFFSSNRADANNYEIYSIRTRDQCLQRHTYNLAQDRDPAISPDGKTMAFVRDYGKRSDLLLTEIRWTTRCLNGIAN